MSDPPGVHLAQLNVGRLLAPPEDPRVAEFMNALDLVNDIGKKSPGFIWMMEGSGAPNVGNTETYIGDDPQFVTNLTVWQDVESLENFVWNTVHRKFYLRRREWFEVLDRMHLVLWWVPAGHRPDLAEALAKLDHLNRNGGSAEAFGWSGLNEAKLWRTRRCEAQSA